MLSKRAVDDRFSSPEEEELVELVSRHELLWKLSDPEYKNNPKKDVIWNTIGEQLGKSGTACKNRWRNIRDYYKRSRREDVTSTGKPAKKKKANYWDMLSFLDDTEHERIALTNAHSYEAADDSLTEDILQFETPRFEDITDSQSTSTATSTRDALTQMKEKAPNKKKVTTQDAVLKALKERKEERERLMNTVEAAFQPVVEKEDDIDYFFKSVALTVKNFSQTEKAQAKMKVMEVVTAIEMSRFSSTNDRVYYPNYFVKPTTNHQGSLSTSPVISSAMQCLSPDDVCGDMRSEYQRHHE